MWIGFADDNKKPRHSPRFQTVEKGRSTASKRRKTKILFKMEDNISIRIKARISSREPRHCLLSTNTNSTVPTYANEFVFAEYTYLLSKSTQRVEVFARRAHRRHAENRGKKASVFCGLFLILNSVFLRLRPLSTHLQNHLSRRP